MTRKYENYYIFDELGNFRFTKVGIEVFEEDYKKAGFDIRKIKRLEDHFAISQLVALSIDKKALETKIASTESKDYKLLYKTLFNHIDHKGDHNNE